MGKKITPHLDNSPFFNNNKIVLYDVGSRGGLQNKWKLYQRHLSVIGFDADEKAETFNRDKKSDTTIINRLILDKEKNVEFLIKIQPGTSSIYDVNKRYIRNFTDGGGKLLQIVNKLNLRSTTIDSLVKKGLSRPDFMKIDVEGAAYEVCSGAKDSLHHVIGIEAEVWFANLHINSKRFSELELLLREFKFDFYAMKARYGKRWIGREYGNGKGQILYCDALFLKSPYNIMDYIKTKFDNEQSKINYFFRTIFIYIMFGYLDLVKQLIIIADDLISSEVKQEIETLLNKDLASRLKIPNFRGRYRLAYLFYTLYRFFEYDADILGHNYVPVDKDPLGNHFWNLFYEKDEFKKDNT